MGSRGKAVPAVASVGLMRVALTYLLPVNKHDGGRNVCARSGYE